MSPGRPSSAGSPGQPWCIPAGESVGYPRRSIADGEEVELGALRLVARHTPGHTPTHMTYVLEDDGRPVAAFTGGSMLLGSVGRTDLAGPWVTDRLSHLAASLGAAALEGARRTARRSCPPTVSAACAEPDSRLARRTPRTRGHQRAENPALLMDEDAFVDPSRLRSRCLSPLLRVHRTEKPRGCWDSRPRAAHRRATSPSSPLAQRAGEWVIDLRERRAFAARHLVGTLGIRAQRSLHHLPGLAAAVGESAEHDRLGSATSRRRGAPLRGSASRRSRPATSSTTDNGGDPWAGVETASYPWSASLS